MNEFYTIMTSEELIMLVGCSYIAVIVAMILLPLSEIIKDKINKNKKSANIE